MADQERCLARPAQLVKLAMADSRRDLADHDLVRAGIGNRHLLYLEHVGVGRCDDHMT